MRRAPGAPSEANETSSTHAARGRLVASNKQEDPFDGEKVTRGTNGSVSPVARSVAAAQLARLGQLV